MSVQLKGGTLKMEKNENMNNLENNEDLLRTDFRFVSITGCGINFSMKPSDIEWMTANNAFEHFKNNIVGISHDVGEVICLLDSDERSKKAEELYTKIREDLYGFGLDIDYDDHLDNLDATTKMVIVAHDLIHLYETLIDNFDYSKTIEMIRSILPIEEADNSPSNGLNKLSDIEIDPFDTDEDDEKDDDTDECSDTNEDDDYPIPPMMGKTYGGSSDE